MDNDHIASPVQWPKIKNYESPQYFKIYTIPRTRTHPLCFVFSIWKMSTKIFYLSINNKSFKILAAFLFTHPSSCSYTQQRKTIHSSLTSLLIFEINFFFFVFVFISNSIQIAFNIYVYICMCVCVCVFIFYLSFLLLFLFLLYCVSSV